MNRTDPAIRGIYEQKNMITDESGYQMQLDEVTFNGIDLKWGSYVNPSEKVLSFQPAKPAIVSHFRLADAALATKKKTYSIKEKQFVVYREAPESYELSVPPTTDTGRSFFELVMTDQFFDNLFTEESEFMACLYNYAAINTPSSGFTAQMLPGMFSIISDMQGTPYSGYLKGLYLEAKTIELFLMQVSQLDQGNKLLQSKLNQGDTERMYAIKDYLAAHYHQPVSISGLARMAGINQTKLKSGFKELFGTTVFGYFSELRMQEAKRLLLDEKLYVSEVADRIGYKHPHHFTVAFKKKFGVSPGSLK